MAEYELQVAVVKDDPRKPWKAIYGALVSGLASVGTALADGEGITGGEAVGIASAVVVAFGAVYFAENPKVAE